MNGRDARSTRRTEWEEWRSAKRREFLKAFREKTSQFVYVKHFIIGGSILYGTDDLTDWSWEEWRHCPDTTDRVPSRRSTSSAPAKAAWQECARR